MPRKTAIAKEGDRHPFFYNYKGDKIKAKYPAGKIVANDDCVYLFKTGSNKFAVVYALETTSGLTMTQAASKYGHCVIHQAQCNGLLD